TYFFGPLGTSYWPPLVVAADFNGDGKQDLAEAVSGTVNILLGNGDGTFQYHRAFKGGSYPVSMAVGDFNGDGKLDIVIVDYFVKPPPKGLFYTLYNDLVVLLGNGDGTFGIPHDVPVLVGAIFVAVADVNRDGIPDLIVANAGE